MSFALPNALWLAAIAVPIIVFYVLKLRLRRQLVSTNLFWKQIYDEKPPRSIWQYLRHLLSLLVQLCVLALLVLAVADPYLPWQLLQARRIVAVIDRSASMRAADVEPTRFEAAVAAAVTLVDGLRFHDEMAIVAAGPRPEVIVGMSRHAPTLKRALRGIAVSDNPANLSSAIELGKQLVGDHPRGQVLVYSDGCTKELPQEPKTGTQPRPQTLLVKHHTFGTRAANVGITQLQVRRSLVDPLGYEVLVAVQNASGDEVDCRLELELNGLPVDVLPLRLKPEEKWRRSLQKTSIEGGRLAATLTQIRAPQPSGNETPNEPIAKGTPPLQNVLRLDDTAWAILPARKLQRVLLITEGNLFLQKVFEANPLVQCEVHQSLPSRLQPDTIVVLHRQVPPQLPPGNVFVVDPTGGCDEWDLGDVIENPIVTEQQKDSPLMTHVRLDNVLMPKARRIEFKAPPEVLAGTLSGDAVYAAVKRDAGKCLVLSIDLDQSDLAFRTAFPIMATNALGWFRGEAGELRSSLPTGQMAKFNPEELNLADKTNLILRSPTGREFPIARVQELESTTRQASTAADPEGPSAELAAKPAAQDLSLGPLDVCGVWTLVSRDAEDREVTATELAVNLANERESDLRSPAELLANPESVSFAAGWFARPLWFYLAGCACALCVAEWLLYQRRVIT